VEKTNCLTWWPAIAKSTVNFKSYIIGCIPNCEICSDFINCRQC
jgi:hypothetical protein